MTWPWKQFPCRLPLKVSSRLSKQQDLRSRRSDRETGKRVGTALEVFNVAGGQCDADLVGFGHGFKTF
jgi:hypothetical protein